MNCNHGRTLLALGMSIPLLWGCGGKGDAANSSDEETLTNVVSYDDDDWYTDYDENDCEVINLGDYTDKVTIVKAGTYVLQGTLKGQVEITVNKNDTVRLILDQVNITAENGPAISCTECKKLILSLPEGTKNMIADGSSYQDQSEDAPDAAIFSQDDLTINGLGELNVNAKYQDAVKTKDTLKLMSGRITVKAADDGFFGKDFLYVHEGTYAIDTGGDGLKTTYDKDNEKGDMVIENGTFAITAGNDGLQSEHSLAIYDGTFTITTGGGSVNSVTAKNAFEPGGFGRWEQPAHESSQETTASAKGVKAGSSLTIYGGVFQMDTSDDSLHSNGALTVEGANFTIASGDDGMHSDGTLTIQDGTVDITKSYEGIEGSNVIINGGDLLVTADDDGINAAGGNDNDNESQPSPDHFANGDHVIEIHGGSLQVDARGDGADANGSIVMDGGTMVIWGPEDGGNGALDYDSACDINGGILIALGSSQMAQAPSSNSSQNVIMFNLSAQSAQSFTYLTDSAGNVILGFNSPRSYSNIVISSPKLESGETYQLYTGGSGGSVNDYGYIESGISGGTQAASVTLNDRITSSGNAMGDYGAPLGNPQDRNPGGNPEDFSDRPARPDGGMDGDGIPPQRP